MGEERAMVPRGEHQGERSEHGQYGGPEEEAPLLARVQGRPGVEDRQIAAGVGGDVLDVEVVLEQRPLEREDGDEQCAAQREDGVAGAAGEVGTILEATNESRERPPDPHEQGEHSARVPTRVIYALRTAS